MYCPAWGVSLHFTLCRRALLLDRSKTLTSANDYVYTFIERKHRSNIKPIRRKRADIAANERTLQYITWGYRDNSRTCRSVRQLFDGLTTHHDRLNFFFFFVNNLGTGWQHSYSLHVSPLSVLVHSVFNTLDPWLIGLCIREVVFLGILFPSTGPSIILPSRLLCRSARPTHLALLICRYFHDRIPWSR